MAVIADQMVEQKLDKAKESDGLNPTDNKFDTSTDLAVGEAKAAFAEGLFLDPQQLATAGCTLPGRAAVCHRTGQIRDQSTGDEDGAFRVPLRRGRQEDAVTVCGLHSSCAGAEGVVGEKSPRKTPRRNQVGARHFGRGSGSER